MFTVMEVEEIHNKNLPSNNYYDYNMIIYKYINLCKL